VRSSFAAILHGFALPFGRTAGRRIVFDGDAAEIRFYNAADELVGFLGTNRWFAGRETGGARVQLDPLGGLRIFDENGLLVGVFDGQGLQIRDPLTGLVHVNVGHHGTTFTAQDGKQIHLIPSQDGNLVVPKWAGLAPPSFPGANVATPPLVAFTPNDLELRYGIVGSNVTFPTTFTPPAGYTEVFDEDDDASALTLAVTCARRQPAVPDATRNFVCSEAGHVFHNGHTLLVRANDTGPAPSVRSHSKGFSTTTAEDVTLTLAAPAGVADLDVEIAEVSVYNKGGFVPTSWSVPEGWQFLGAVFQTLGATETLASGFWWKQATASEPANYSVEVQIPGPGTKRFHTSIVAVQDAGILEGGSDIRFEPQSACRVFAAVGTNTNFPALATGVVVDFDQKSYDPGNNYDLATNIYTVPASGPYKFGFQLHVLCGTGESFRANVSRAGTEIAGTGNITAPGPAVTFPTDFPLICHDVAQLDEGDQISVDAVQNDGVVRGLAGFGSPRSFFYIKRDLST
jgi:hypothetical protein